MSPLMKISSEALWPSDKNVCWLKKSKLSAGYLPMIMHIVD
jgi:hypothetical protein